MFQSVVGHGPWNADPVLQYEQQSLLGSIGVVSSKHVEALAPAKNPPLPLHLLFLSRYLPAMLAASVQLRPGLSSPCSVVISRHFPALKTSQSGTRSSQLFSPGDMKSSGGAA